MILKYDTGLAAIAECWTGECTASLLGCCSLCCFHGVSTGQNPLNCTHKICALYVNFTLVNKNEGKIFPITRTRGHSGSDCIASLAMKVEMASQECLYINMCVAFTVNYPPKITDKLLCLAHFYPWKGDAVCGDLLDFGVHVGCAWMCCSDPCARTRKAVGSESRLGQEATTVDPAGGWAGLPFRAYDTEDPLMLESTHRSECWGSLRPAPVGSHIRSPRVWFYYFIILFILFYL